MAVIEIKITVENVPIDDWEDIRFEYYKNGKHMSSWWTGAGRSFTPTIIDTLTECVRTDLERYVDKL